MHKMIVSRIAGCAVMAGLVTCPTMAQDNADEIARINAARDLIKAETERYTAETARMEAQTARIEALPLPGFEGTTALGTTGGAMEASILSTDALGAAALMIASDPNLTGERMVVVTGETLPNIIQGLAFRQEIDELNAILNLVDPASDPTAAGGGLGVAGGMAAASALAGVLRTETTLSYMSVAEIDSDLLAMAVARRMGARAVMPGNVYGVGEGGEALLEDYQRLVERVALVTRKHGQTAYTGENLRRFQAATARFNTFSTNAMKAGTNGLPAIFDAARLMGVYDEDTNVLRVEVHRAGGGMTNSSNIGTFFGADPVRVSGGLVVSYSQFDPDDGTMYAGDLLTCTTTFTSIRRVQDRSWERNGSGAQCARRLGR